MALSDIVPIQINDKAFMIASTIERCPKTMMLRELVMNAIEAASKARLDGKKIEVRVTELHGASKLTIWNAGEGMDGQQLHDMCDLSSSLGKKKSLDQNFGIGAKVASLPSNKFGMRYRSCRSGRVHEVILCERSGIYGRLRRKLDDHTFAEVIDVTEAALAEGKSLSEDWTEVTLLGNRPDQNTARDPYDGDPEVDAQWIATYLYHRFYRLPEGVKITLQSGTHKLGPGARSFATIPDRVAAGAFDRCETVVTDEGITIHYLYDGPYSKMPSHNRSISGALQSAVSTCCIVFKNEMYDVRRGKSWTLDAPLFGLPFGAKYISVHVELPEASKVRPEGYRTFLRKTSGDQDQVQVNDFALLVARHRPQWLIDLIRSLAPDAVSNEDIRNELQKLLDELRVRRQSPRTNASGETLVTPRDGVAVTFGRGRSTTSENASQSQRHVDLSVVPEGTRRADIWQNRERAPVIVPLRTEAEIEEKQIKERAARYYDNCQLFVNMLYPAIQRMKESLEREYAEVSDVEQMRTLALQLAEQTIMLRVGRAVVFALAKQENKEWDSEAVAKALSPESLSLAADDFHDAMQSARRKMGKTFRLSGNSSEHLVPDLAPA